MICSENRLTLQMADCGLQIANSFRVLVHFQKYEAKQAVKTDLEIWISTVFFARVCEENMERVTLVCIFPGPVQLAAGSTS